MERRDQIHSWLSGLWPKSNFSLEAASADASFRRYFRARHDDGRSFIIMDAPPTYEDCRPWLHVQGLFLAAGVRVPEVIAQDLERGFLLLSDLGNTTYLQALTPENSRDLYAGAVSALVKIQRASRPGALPDYDRALLRRELELFPEWFLTRHHGIEVSDRDREALDQVFDRILDTNLAEPRVFVHRDYHSRNLMHLPGHDSPGVIDFQDAVFGPISYDMVSLLKDAYIEWDEDVVLDWLIRYWELARRAGLPVAADFGEFFRAYEWMGVQRHVKVLGIFCRLWHRDGKDGYLKDLPLVARYLRKACERYDELSVLRHLLDRVEDKVTVLGYTLEQGAL